jgi:hypothetical protein
VVVVTVRDPLPLDLLRLRVAAGAPLDHAADLPPRAVRALAVAEATGAPIHAAIDAARDAADDEAAGVRAIAVASAQTKAVAGGLLVAPVLLVPGIGRLAGVDLLAFYGTPFGLLVLGVGLALLGAGATLIALLVRRVGAAAGARRPAARGAHAAGAVAALLAWRTVGPAAVPLAYVLGHAVLARRSVSGPPSVGLDEAADLAAVAVSGGCGPAESLRRAAAELPHLAERLHRLAFALELGMRAEDLTDAPTGDPLRRLAALVSEADAIGAPLAPTLRRLARDVRADDLAQVLAAAERLPAQLTFPTALAILPATVLLIGAPIVHTGLAGVGL